MNLNAFPPLATLTVKEAELIAAQHEDDKNWDFWEYLASIDNADNADNAQNVDSIEQEADHA